MQTKTVILTETEPFLKNDHISEVINIEINFDNYPLDNLGKLSNQLKNLSIRIKQLKLLGQPFLSEKNQEIIAHFILQLIPVQSVIYSSDAFNKAQLIVARTLFLSEFNVTDSVNIGRTVIDKWVSRNESPQQKLYYLLPQENSDADLLNTYIVDMGDWFFINLLVNFTTHTNQWVVNLDLNQTQLACLANYVNQAAELPFERLSLYINIELTQTIEFNQLLDALSAKSLRGLTLVFAPHELAEPVNQNHVAELLEKNVLPSANFPVQIALKTDKLKEQLYKGDAFKLFEMTLIRKMQSVNNGNYIPPTTTHQPKISFPLPPEKSEKKIALKQLLGKGKIPPKEILERFQNQGYIQAQVQYVAVQQQQQQQQQQTVASQVQMTNQTNVQAVAGVYEGKLVDFAEFSSEPYQNIALAAGHQHEQLNDLYRVVQQEFFANMPYAIKYFSPEAAKELAENLANFCALNSDNLPKESHFILKQTSKGEMVLDVNRYTYQKQVNPFTPKLYKLPAQQPLMYQYQFELRQENVITWINHDELFNLVCYRKEEYDIQKLENLWAKFGEAGIKKLFAELKALDKKHPGLAEFLVTSYLNYFPDWELFLLPKTQFFANLQRLNKYDATQLTCLKKFMVNSGCSQHHLTNTLDAFDAFWENISALCQQQSVNIAEINSDWRTGTGYVPIFLATPEQVKQLKPGELAITDEGWTDSSKADKTLTCYVNNDGKIIQFDINQKELETAWLKKNPCIFITAEQKLDADTLARLPCSAYILCDSKFDHYRMRTKTTIYYFDHKRRHLLRDEFNDEHFSCFDKIKRKQYQMQDILDFIDSKISIAPERLLTWEELSEIHTETYLCHNPVYNRLFQIPKSYFNHRVLQDIDLEPIWLDVLEIADEQKYIKLKSGNPPIYMERFLKMAKKARDLAEQLIALDRVTLDNYSAAYASEFELFQVVSSAMGLCYRPDKQNNWQFNRSKRCYSIALDDLLTDAFQGDKYSKNKRIALLLRDLCRVVGQVKHGISINRYVSELQHHFMHPDTMMAIHTAQRLTLILLFLINERYQGEIPLERLLSDINSVDNHDVIYYLEKQLKQFLAFHIYFNDVEGEVILRNIGRMNSTNFEYNYGRNKNKNYYIEKLFRHLENNQYGVFKLLKKVSKNNGMFVKALDIAEYWEKTYPILQSSYREDLLLFAFLISDVSYFEKMEYKQKSEALEKINKVADWLLLAAQSPYPNNYDYAFKLIVKSEHFFHTLDFIQAFEKLHELSGFKPIDVENILQDKKFELPIFNPISINKQFYLQEKLIHLIFTLKHFKKTGNFLFNQPVGVLKEDLENIIKQEQETVSKLKIFTSRNEFLTVAKEFNLLKLRDEFLTAKEFDLLKLNLSKVDFLNYSCSLKKIYPPPLHSFEEFEFPIIFTHEDSFDNQLMTMTWLAYIDNQGKKQLKVIADDFKPQDHLDEIKTSALYFLQTLDDKKKDELKKEMNSLYSREKELKMSRQDWEEKNKIYEDWRSECTQLRQLSMKDLNQKFFDLWNNQDLISQIAISFFFHQILDNIKPVLITNALSTIGHSTFPQQLQQKLVELSDFNDVIDNFDKLSIIVTKAERLALDFKNWLETPSFKTYKKDFIEMFNDMDYTKWNFEALTLTLSLITQLNPADYRTILKTLLTWHNTYHPDVKKYLVQLDKIRWLSASQVSIDTINKWLPFISDHSHDENEESVYKILQWVINAEELKDPLLDFLSRPIQLNITNIEKIIRLTEALLLEEKMAVNSLFLTILNDKNAVNDITAFLDSLNTDQAINILKLIATCQLMPMRKGQAIEYPNLVEQLNKLSAEDFRKIETFCLNSSLNIQDLSFLAAHFDNDKSIENSISDYERAPFGPRNFEAQFTTSELGRIVNGITDLKNQSRRTYQARKQLMEAVLYVNALGKDLPAYLGKPAKNLSNAEIQQLFTKLKNNELIFPNRFAKQLYALGLLREAVYRKTGIFAYCSQLAAVINSMQAPDDQNILDQIDTGQGKTLTDTLKAILLWLDHDGGEVITSSPADARRDHGLFLSALKFLRIPVADKPITQTSDFDEFQTEGINYGTVADFSLFYARAAVCAVRLRSKNAKIFMVLSEADRATLDDHTIFRYAELDPEGIGSENEWLFYAITEFVRLPEFKNDNNSEQEDILFLRNYLACYARDHQIENSSVITSLTDDELLTWLNSAIIVKRLLQKDIHYVTRPGEKVINGHLQRVSEIKIIQEADNRVDENAVFDKKIQPMLCAYLNSKLPENEKIRFVIEPSTKTILASNSKNLIRKYAKTGVIFGSTATAGSLEEILGQVDRYQFVCSAIPPYQQNQIDKNPLPFITQDINDQYGTILAAIKKSWQKEQKTVLVAWKTIPKAKAFYEWLKQQGYNEHELQQYTDQDGEQELIIIKNAPNKITSSTRGLGRNTDIPYDREQGMLVIQTQPDTLRNTVQLAGRTGREGSKGSFLRIYNQKDFPRTTYKDAITQLEKVSQQRREIESRLFDLLTYLLERVEDYFDDNNQHKANFLKTVWADFIGKAETDYRQMEEKDKFIPQAVGQFNSAMKEKGYDELIVNSEELKQLAEKLNPMPTPILPYQIYDMDVKQSDCIPVSIIAYHALPTEEQRQVEGAQIDENKIKDSVKNLLENTNSSSFNTPEKVFQKHLLPLMSDALSLKTIRKTVQQEFTQLLYTKLQQNASLSWFERAMLGMKSDLEQVADDRHYLNLFNALTVSAENPNDIDIDLAKSITVALLNDYLTNCWFISEHKVNTTQRMIKELDTAQGVEELIRLLVIQKNQVLEKDILINQSKNSFWQTHVNKKGSRFQTHIDKVLLLLDSLQLKEQTDEAVLNDLLKQLQSIVVNEDKKDALTRLINNNKEFDSIKSFLPTLTDFNDEKNAAVILNSLNKWLDHHLNSHSLFPGVEKNR